MKLNCIFIDEEQSKRFLSFLAKSFPDTTFYVIINPKKSTPLQILKFRNTLVRLAARHQYYGYIRLINFDKEPTKDWPKISNACIIQDFSSKADNLPPIEKQFRCTKINTIRTLKNNTKKVVYEIKSNYKINQKKAKILTSDAFINSGIYTLNIVFRIKRFLGNIRRQVRSRMI